MGSRNAMHRVWGPALLRGAAAVQWHGDAAATGRRSLVHTMLLAQSGKSQGFGDSVPKSHRSTLKPDEPQFRKESRMGGAKCHAKRAKRTQFPAGLRLPIIPLFQHANPMPVVRNEANSSPAGRDEACGTRAVGVVQTKPILGRPTRGVRHTSWRARWASLRSGFARQSATVCRPHPCADGTEILLRRAAGCDIRIYGCVGSGRCRNGLERATVRRISRGE